ncbi:MAG TPA: TVP38/TMEM64 family protein [Gemmataceae bacterium]|nr:TVP38/TMEM64 family protein [Gemmataceae bacterium]
MTRTYAPRPSRGVTAAVNRYAPLIKGGSVVVIVVSIALMLRRLPFGPVIDNLDGWIAGAGIWGPLVFGLLYVAVSLLLGPAWALTLAAGAIFGLGLGTLVVSLAATTAAGLAFLIARYFARQRIAHQIQHYPRFDATDRAVSEGGWKIVALLRLSPAVPFTLQNYLYGLTGIRFCPYLLTSWLAMLPGTFLYIYLGHIGRAGVEATRGGRTRTPAEWAMLVAGLLATAAATVYITRLARKALRKRAGAVEEVAAEPAAAQGWPWGATILAAVALAILVAALFVCVAQAACR